MADELNIMIIDDHPIVRQGIRKIIEKEPDMTVCAEASSAGEAINYLSKGTVPDCAVVDISLEGEVNGIELVKALRERYKEIVCLVLSMYDESVYAERAIRAGARGYVTKKEAPTVVVKALRTIVDGDLFLSSGMSGKIIDKLVHGGSEMTGAPVDTLTDREFEIFQLIGNGLGTGEIAKKLNLSVNTIESHRKKIKDKLGIKTGPALVKTAVQFVINQNR